MHFGLHLAHVLLLAPRLVQASSGAYWVQPSQKWVDIDGTWSSFEVNLGAPAQPVQLLVSTAISEVWAIGRGGCPQNSNACATERGNTYNAPDSQNYAPLGAWELGLASSGFSDTGDYGLDRLSMFNSLEGETVSINNALVASINTTNFYQGYIGLGVIRGRFGERITTPLISQMVEEYGLIASNSYGYTAGAWHIDGGVPASLILGGYDPLRFQNHNTVFNLDPDSRVPQVRLRGINANTNDPSKPPPGWGGQIHKSLVAMNDSLVVTIDTSFPYLALPESICDRFADALNLTYNSTFDLYMFSGDQLTSPDSALRADRLNFTFSLSSWDNNNTLGKPLEDPGVINITISGQAFSQYLTYPYRNSFEPYDPGLAYFPLRRAKNVNEFVIGRAFMQEAYMITKYEERLFSVYQARYPSNAASNYSVKPISRPANSDYPAFVPKPPNRPGLTAGQTAGVVVGVVAASVGICVALWLWRRQRTKAAQAKTPMSPSEKNGDELCQDGGSTLGPDEPAGPLTRFVSFITGGRRPRRGGSAPLSHELDGSRTQPVEVGADAAHERYEMPVPLEPVELDATHEHMASDDTMEFGTEGSEHGMSQYEIARRKMQRQLQGPLPTYSPSTVPIVHIGHPSLDGETGTKLIQDVSSVGHYRPGDDENPSPTVSAPSEGNNTNSFSSQVPSPMSPNPEWGARFLDLPSPITVASPGQFPLRRTGSASSPGERQRHVAIGRSNSNGHGASQTTARSPDLLLPPTAVQRTPIDQSEIVCLGPLPENICLPNQQSPLPRNQTTILPSDSASQAAGTDASTDMPTSPPSSHMPAYPQRSTTPPTAATSRQPLSPQADPRRGLRIETPSNSFGLIKRASRRDSSESLGSDFTVDEEERMVDNDIVRQQDRRAADADGVSPQSTSSPERIDAATELIHIPQVSERRYSWEDDKR
ncbi:hypothetical protein PpBr36_01263 [Pyricularia pennisetigena]|uniref:hypothetical protein n=1 Tax=Pyricularia pennisetigena TaxID=1578925 RepID=UPI001153D7CE|nr:hypothetical protein PpBr36_01263 [Pyricularia pennisetigena]TLS29821.1 hypothetical protein PpBr36_01263 [Pyricularia pennisetigena]